MDSCVCDFINFDNRIKCLNSYHRCNNISTLNECNSNTDAHLKSIKLSNVDLNEKKIILMRYGLDFNSNKYDLLKICPAHRLKMGLMWRQSLKCSYSEHAFLSKQKKLDYSIKFDLAEKLLKLKNDYNCNNKFYKLGSQMCRICFDDFTKKISKLESKCKFHILNFNLI